jgi:hypothetical protein
LANAELKQLQSAVHAAWGAQLADVADHYIIIIIIIIIDRAVSTISRSFSEQDTKGPAISPYSLELLFSQRAVTTNRHKPDFSISE